MDRTGRNVVNGIVFNEGYYLNTNTRQWINFSWEGTQIFSRDGEGLNQNTGWVRGGGQGNPTPSASLTLEDHTDEDYTIFLGYVCSKFFQISWDCNEGKWIIFVVETGTIDYHSNIGDVPEFEYTEIADLDISDIPSILKQFDVDVFDFQPTLNDLLNVEVERDVSGEVGTIQELRFFVKNLGNQEVNNIIYQLDIGERSLVEVVNADLPSGLGVDEGAFGTIEILLKEEHRQTITLWARTSLEVDTSDNMALFTLEAGDKARLNSVRDRVSYHGNTGDVLIVNREPFEVVSNFADRLFIKAGNDLVRTVFGGYYNETSINPTLKVYVRPILVEEALYSTPFVNSIFVGGEVLTGDREVIHFSVKIINSKTNVFYETPELESQFKYFFNPKDLIPDFEFCTDYLVETTILGGNEETIDVIEAGTFNLCNFSKTGGTFSARRILKSDGDFVVITPSFDKRYYDSLDVEYYIEFNDSLRNRIYRTQNYNIAEGVVVAPLNSILLGSTVDFVTGTLLQGRVVLLDDSGLEARGRDCFVEENGISFSGFSNDLGLENWEAFNAQSQEESDIFLCLDDTFYQCGGGEHGELSRQKVNVDDKIGGWTCEGTGWTLEEETEFLISEVSVEYIKTIVTSSESKKIFVYNKNEIPFIDESIVINASIFEIRTVFGKTLDEILSISQFALRNRQNRIDTLDYKDYYFICIDCQLSIVDVTVRETRSIKKITDNSLKFMWNDFEIITNLGVSLFLKNDFIRMASSNEISTRMPFIIDEKQSVGAYFPDYFDKEIETSIFDETIFRLQFFDLTENVLLDETIIDNNNNRFRNVVLNYDEYFPILENGHVYESIITVESPNARLFKPFTERFFYIDGYNFLLQNEFLYSQFYGLQNFPKSVKASFSEIGGKGIPQVKIEYTAANIQFDRCLGRYSKLNFSTRFLDIFDECKYPSVNFVDHEVSIEPLFSNLVITLIPLDGISVEEKRSEFNCKIGRFDGVCFRSNYGMQFAYVDNRTNLMYRIFLNDESGRFIKKYRDASSGNGEGNDFDLVLYDILSRIESSPIVDFDLDLPLFDRPIEIPNNEWMFNPGDSVHYTSNGDSIFLYYPDANWGNNDFVLNVFNTSYDLVHVVTPSEIESRLFGEQTGMNTLASLDLDTTNYYVQKNGFTMISMNYWGRNYFTSEFLWEENVAEWFFKNKITEQFSKVPENLQVSLDFYRPVVQKGSFSSEIPNTYQFIFSLNPVNSNVGDFTFLDFEEWLQSYLALNSEDKRTVQESLEPSVIDVFGGIKRSYEVKVSKYDDIYLTLKNAPQNCENTLDDSQLRDVVCSSHIYGESGGTILRFSCTWANLDKLEIYDLKIKQKFINRDVSQVENLPTSVIEDLKGEFFNPVLSHYLAMLSPTPILNTTFGTFEDFSVCS